MPPVLACLHHLDRPFLGLAERPLRDAGIALDERLLVGGHALPELDDVDGLLAFGGTQSARDLDTDPVLRAEAELLRDAVDAGVPVLGVCLGGQVLARALGAEVRRASVRTIAWRELEPLPAGREDPLVGALAAPVPALHWNDDVFDLPSGATELFARRGEGVEAFRAGACAWGLQFHPEVDAAALDGWYARYGDWFGEVGITIEDARAADTRHMAAQADLAERLFGAFARVVAEHASVRRA